MKTTRLLLLILLPLLVMACGRGGDRESLVRLDSLVLAAPDSALHLLQSLPDDSLPTDDDRAYHAVLLAEAAYKAYIPATADSAILAAERHYASRDRAKHLRALICCGTTAEELGHPEEAMRRYKQAETLARDLRDTFRIGYTLLRQAKLYHRQQNTAEIAIARYKSAMECFDAVHSEQSEHYHDICCLEVGSLYRVLDLDSANRYLDLAYNSAINHSNIGKQCQILNLKAELFLLKKDADNTLELCQMILDHNHPTTSIKVYFTLAEAYILKGQLKDAQKALEACHPLSNAVDTMKYHYEYAKLADSMNDLNTYKKHHLISDSISDSIMMSTLALKLQSAENNFTQSQLELSIAAKELERAKTVNVLLFVLALLLAAVSASSIIYQKAATARAELYNANVEMSLLRTKLGEQISMIQQQKEKLENLSSDNMTQKSIVDELRAVSENQEMAMRLHDRLLGELLHQYRQKSSPFGIVMTLYKLSNETFWEPLDYYTRLRYPKLMSDCTSSNGDNKVNIRDRQILVLYAMQIPLKIIALCFNFSNPRSVSNELPRILQRMNAPEGMNATEYMASISAFQTP